jgi:mannose-6-phosphate isomerase-like protein (cupin superfamily)
MKFHVGAILTKLAAKTRAEAVAVGVRQGLLAGSISGTNSKEGSMMNDSSTPTREPAAVTPPGKLAHATPTTAPLVAGRRSFFKYRDLGVTAASSGKIRAQVTIGAEGMTQPTGWHYHVCEGQFVYMLNGWVDLVFEDGQKVRLQSGESLYIPGGLRHNEIGASRDLELLEISVPADMGTVACDPPEGWSARA